MASGVAMAVLLVQAVSVPTVISHPRQLYGDIQPSFILQQNSEVTDPDDSLRLEKYPPIPTKPSSEVLALEWFGGTAGGFLSRGCLRFTLTDNRKCQQGKNGVKSKHFTNSGERIGVRSYSE